MSSFNTSMVQLCHCAKGVNQRFKKCCPVLRSFSPSPRQGTLPSQQQQLATLYNDTNGCQSLPGLENYLLITTNWAGGLKNVLGFQEITFHENGAVLRNVFDFDQMGSSKSAILQKTFTNDPNSFHIICN